jgi:hypothetical protein
VAAAAPWYERAGATYVTLVDEQHRLSSLYNLVNVPSAVWIDQAGSVRRIDEGAYATSHDLDGFAFGRDDYAPLVVDWVRRGEDSPHVSAPGTLSIPARTDAQARAEATFKLAPHFHASGDAGRAVRYWEAAQALNPASWNYARQHWSFSPETAGERWLEKYQTLNGKPYYRPIEGLDGQSEGE